MLPQERSWNLCDGRASGQTQGEDVWGALRPSATSGAECLPCPWGACLCPLLCWKQYSLSSFLAEDTVLSVTVILLLKSQQCVDAQKSEISMKRAVDNGCASTSGLNSAEQPSFERVVISSCCYMPWVVISACIYVGKGYGFSWGLLFSCYELVQRGPVLGSALYFCLQLST